ncbi:Zinc finger protein [Fusarium oxysporum f. sp. albedinis]|nr:Zinc finger protein [Fusarium oxysporum f. sp. albedinis]
MLLAGSAGMPRFGASPGGSTERGAPPGGGKRPRLETPGISFCRASSDLPNPFPLLKYDSEALTSHPGLSKH